MITYKKFKQLGIDLFEPGFENYPYFCTPKGATIFGWEGIDGIHYCFIRGFSETVFSVSPSNTPGDYVHPVAADFADFLGLILSCKGTAAIEQAHGWTRSVFDDFVATSEPDSHYDAVLKITEKFSVEPITDPYDYIKKLQASFDYKKIKFEPDYYETVPDEILPEKFEWKVYFDEDFWKHRSRSRAGQEYPLNVKFDWNGNKWLIPAVYICSKGLVLDICTEIDPEKVGEFLDKWLFVLQYDDNVDSATRRQIENENPLDIDYISKLTLNGREMRNFNGCSINWMPDSVRPDGTENTKEAQRVIDHYGLDASRAWVFRRASFPYTTSKKPKLESLSVCFEQHPVELFCPCFSDPSVGDKIEITHPLNGEKYTLTVLETEQKILDGVRLEGYDFPKHYTSMKYTLCPDISGRFFSVRDCCEGDQPRQIKETREKTLFEPTATNAASIGIIGGADGPTAVMFSHGVDGSAEIHIACSSCHFEPAKTVEWQPVFREKTCEDIDIKLI